MTHQKGNILELEGYLNQKTRVRIRDGRVFIGKFVCIDKQKNIILSQANEYRGAEERLVGSVMIPGAHLTKIETETISDFDMFT